MKRGGTWSGIYRQDGERRREGRDKREEMKGRDKGKEESAGWMELLRIGGKTRAECWEESK